MARVVNRGFGPRRRQPTARPTPPGQYVTDDFPVLTAGVTPSIDTAAWTFTILDEGSRPLARWTWDELLALPAESVKVDIHCVTGWSKQDTHWTGVSIDTLFDGLDISAEHVMAFCEAGYTTNVPVADLVDGHAWIAYDFEGDDLPVEHGGPARLLVPHLYFWKSAKWVRGLRLLSADEPGFWEGLGYHNHGDPWREERYWND